MNKRFSIINYTAEHITAHESDDVAEILTAVQDNQTTWITFDRYTPNDRNAVEQLLSHFSITSVTTDQIFNKSLEESLGEFPDCLYAKFGLPLFDLTTMTTNRIWGNVILGKKYLLLFTENNPTVFDHSRNRILSQDSRVRHHGSDYLLYLLIRSLIIKLEDSMFGSLVERFEKLEDEVIASEGEPEILDKILALREQVKPFYESLRRLGLFVDTIDENDKRFISKRASKLFATKIERNIESLWQGYTRLHDWSIELIDIHRANIGERTNRIMHILTIVSTIFLPITFLASLYGMNFQRMNFLNDPLGYDKTLGMMVLIVIGMVIYMKWKKWI